MSKKNRAKSHIKQRYFRKIVPRIKKEGPSKTGGSRSDPSEVTSVDGGQSYGEIFDSQADRINRKSSKSSGGRRSIDSALDEILPEREKVVKSDKKSKNKKNRSFIMGQDVLQKMHSSRNDKERNSNRDVSNRAKNPASNFSRNKSSRSVAFPAMKLIKVVRESEGGVQRMNESSIRSLNLSSVLKDRTIIMDTKSAFLGGQSSYKTSASILQEK
uniref:Uncharacterized protein n=1 Tax=Romanomermis culicivorax TaxID=13658 RepID=A0A915IYU1_ROMCU